MPGSKPRRGLRFAAAVLACLLVAELAARALAPGLPEPLVYGDEATQVKVAQMARAGDDCVDVVLAGDSTGRDAFDPALFTGHDPAGRRAYNASLDAASPVLLRRWLHDEVVPRLQPQTVVVTVSSLDLNAAGAATTSAVRAYDDAPATRDGVFGPVERFLTEHSMLVRERRQLRDPATLWDALQRRSAGEPPPRSTADAIEGVLGADGQGLSRRSLHYRHDAGTKSFTRDQLLAGYRVDPAQVDALAGLVAATRADGRDVVVVILPVTDDYVALHPNGRADFDAFLAATKDAAARGGARLVDLHDATPPPDAFADTHHFNETGTRWFSEQLGALVPGASRTHRTGNEGCTTARPG